MSVTSPHFRVDLSTATNADELFVRYSIPELRSLENKTRIDIGNKKQELRLMVGERYRDLIDAADSIVNMRQCSLSIEERLLQMQNSCDVKTLKQDVSVQLQDEKKGTKDDKKYHLYSTAAQIKLLVDVPEQIWRSLESHKYLNASRLYLIAKRVYKNLQVHNESMPFSIPTSFPVVQRQWDAVSHFKTQILQKATLFLKTIDQSEQSLAEALCAIMLLDDVTMKDVFRMFLDMRTSALSQFLENKDNQPLTECLKDVISLVRSTVVQVGLVFNNVGNEKSLFEIYLKQLQQGFTIHTDNLKSPYSAMSPRESKTSLTRLYSASTNIHLLIRYLPESIQTLTPFLHMTGPRGQLSQEDVRLRMNLWIDHVIDEFEGGKLGLQLANIKSARELNNIRASLWDALRHDESAAVDETKPSDKGRVSRTTSLGFVLTIPKSTWSWNVACTLVLNKNFSIWHELFRKGFNNRFQEIANMLLEDLSSQPKTLLYDNLKNLEDPSNEEHNLENFVWKHKDALFVQNRSISHDFKGKIHYLVSAETTIVREAAQAFDKSLMRLLDDFEPIFSMVKLNKNVDVYEDKDNYGILFDATKDVENLVTFFHEALAKAVIAYRDQLVSLMEAATANTVELTNVKRMLFGRIARAIALNSTQLEISLNHSQYEMAGSYFTLQKLTHMNPKLLELRESLMEVYISSHDPWIVQIVHAAEKMISDMLQNTMWDVPGVITLVWEDVLLKTNSSEAIKLPAQPTGSVAHCLFKICQEINKAGSPTVDKVALKNLLMSLSTTIFTCYSTFVSSPSFAKVSEKGSVQMLFDIKFLTKVFEGCWLASDGLGYDTDDASQAGNKHEEEMKLQREHYSLVNNVLNTIKGKIDPIDLAVFEPLLNKNIDRHYSRSIILLGLILQLNPRVADISRRKATGIQDYHNIFTVAPQAARFTLLPISHKRKDGRQKDRH
ncbi:8682_t:CDS:10 [Paraglomus brasilianum]|uniref:Conserved oligomeric Golgi complex subunit 1 n=1 Tax=Paraglomus brasilianum TaxID=144538 RepID=A0A9N9B9P6_9GLOM|nr:8682_t:CDS:10 [Paraglomus brasilianum]